MLSTIAFIACVVVITLAAATTDIMMKRIPNYITVPAAILGLLFHLVFTIKGIGLLMAVAGLGLGFVLLFVPWLLGGGGMGDVKLLAALGVWLGPWWLTVSFGVSVILAIVMALSVMAYSAVTSGVRTTRRRYLAVGADEGHKPRKKAARVIPYAVPVALGAWSVLAWLVLTGQL